MADLSTSRIAEVLTSISGNGVSFDVSDKQSNTYSNNSWVIQPSPSYLEFEKSGPLRLKDIKWVDIDPVISVKAGTLVAETKTDTTSDISNHLQIAGVPFEIAGAKIRIRFH